MDIMNIDILNPEFMALAAEAKIVYDKKEKATSVFKKLYMKHKEEIATLDKEAIAIKKKFVAIAKESPTED